MPSFDQELALRSGITQKFEQNIQFWIFSPQSRHIIILGTPQIFQFLDNVFAREEGLPEFLVTDNSVQLTSHKMKEFLEGNGITHLYASLYHPKTNGLMEGMNRTMKEVYR